MRVAVNHNLPSGGGKRALYEQVRRLSVRHTVDAFTLSCAEHAFCGLHPYVRPYYVDPFESGRLYGHSVGRLNQGVRVRDLCWFDEQQRVLAARLVRSRVGDPRSGTAGASTMTFRGSFGVPEGDS